eukprot:1408782-Pyramimonas_sp.AAC.1
MLAGRAGRSPKRPERGTFEGEASSGSTRLGAHDESTFSLTDGHERSAMLCLSCLISIFNRLHGVVVRA